MEWTVETVFPRGQRVGIGRVRGLWVDGHLVEGIRLTEGTMESERSFEQPTSYTAKLDFEIPSDRQTEFLVSDPEIRTLYRESYSDGRLMETATTFMSVICLRLKLRDRTFRCSTVTCEHETTRVRVEMGCANLQVIDSPIDSLGWVRRKDQLIEQLAEASNHRNCRLISDDCFLRVRDQIQEEIAYLQRQVELASQRDPNTQSRVFRWTDTSPDPRLEPRWSNTSLAWGGHHSQAIGDATCLNNAQSNHLRCAVNPTGPCEGCKFYELKH